MQEQVWNFSFLPIVANSTNYTEIAQEDLVYKQLINNMQ